MEIFLFENLRLVVGGTPLEIRSEKLRALLAYLLLHRRTSIERSRLGEVLWPGSDESTARRNLREYLYRLRTFLDEETPVAVDLITDGDLVQFKPPAQVWVDVDAFEQHLAQAEQADHIEAERTHLMAAADLYRGDLLASFWDDWVIPERERLAQRYIEALQSLSDAHQRAGHLTDAIEVAQRVLQLDPLQESSHRRLMQLYYQSGDRTRALHQYKECRQTLLDELAARPLPETRALYQAMLEGSTDTVPRPTVLPRPAPAMAPFVGRGRALGHLTELYEAREHHFVVVVGGSGMGKTRLVNEWLSTLPADTLILRGRAHEFEQTIPYNPLLDALQQSLHLIPWEALPAATTWLAPLAQLLPDLYYYMPELSSADSVLEAEAGHYIQEGFAQLLMSFARQFEVVLFLDDVHWADQATWQFLSFLNRRIRGVFAVCTFSASEATREATSRLHRLERDAARLSLETLTPADVRDLLQQRIGLDAISRPDAFTERLRASTGGNPFFITETIRTLLESGIESPYTPAHLDQLSVPKGVRVLVENRLDRLTEESRRVLAVAAAFGREFSVELLAAAAEVGEDDLLDHFDVWLERGLVEETRDAYDFTHQQVREVAYARLSGPRRRRVHARIAEALSEQITAENEWVAYHYQRSHRPLRAAPGLLAAGRRALSARAYGQARQVGRTLLEILEHAPDTPEDRVARTLQVALAYSFAGETENALRMLEADVDSGSPHAVEVALRAAQLYWVRGDAPQARHYAEEVRQAGGEFELDALRLLGRVAVAQGHFEEAAAYLERSLTLDVNDMNRANTLGYLATAYGHLHESEKAIKALTRALEIARTVGSPAMEAVAHVKAAVAYNYLGEWALAHQHAEEGIVRAKQLDLPVYVFIGQATLGRVVHYEGDSERAYAILQEASHWATSNDYILFRHLPHIFLAEVALAQGDYATVREQVRVIRAVAETTDNRWARERAGTFLAALPR